MLVPGETPRLPLRIVSPVLVTVDAPKTANEVADASGTSPLITGQDIAFSGPIEVLSTSARPAFDICAGGAKPEPPPALPLLPLQPASNMTMTPALSAGLK
jgi:hypothetical protein